MISVPSMQNLLEAGVHFGHQVRRGHPKMAPFIYGARDGVHIINLEHSERLLKLAAGFVRKLGGEGKVVLFVGTKKQAQPIIEAGAQKCNAPYLTARWVGGALTNFDEIRKNIDKLLELKEKQQTGELEHYTKKEQLLISRKLNKFDRELGGVANLKKLPDAIFLSDCVTEKTALTEASKKGIYIIGITDSNCDPTLVNYPIPGNDDATKSIKILTETVVDAYCEGLKEYKSLSADGQELMVKEEKDRKNENVENLEEISTYVAEEVAEAEEEIEQKSLEEVERKVT